MGKKLLKLIFWAWCFLLPLLLLLSYLSPYVHPKSVWWIAFLGLAYPITLTFFFLTLIFLFFKKHKLKYLFLVLFILGIPLHLRLLSINFNTSSNSSEVVKLMSYNVRLFDLYDWLPNDKTEIKNDILATIKDSKPKILCFQEYLLDKTANPHVKIKEINDVGNFKFSHQQVVQEQVNKYFGLATFSTFPIINKGSVFDESQQSQFCIFSDIVIKEDTIRVYNMHLQSIRFQKEDYRVFQATGITQSTFLQKVKNMARKIKNAYPPRVIQTEKIIAHIKTSPYPVIACGDFNDTPLSYVYNLFNKELNDAFRKAGNGIGRTYAGRIPVGRIDYIFVDPTLNTFDFKIHNEVLSDHFAIEVNLGW